MFNIYFLNILDFYKKRIYNLYQIITSLHSIYFLLLVSKCGGVELCYSLSRKCPYAKWAYYASITLQISHDFWVFVCEKFSSFSQQFFHEKVFPPHTTSKLDRFFFLVRISIVLIAFVNSSGIWLDLVQKIPFLCFYTFTLSYYVALCVIFFRRKYTTL